MSGQYLSWGRYPNKPQHYKRLNWATDLPLIESDKVTLPFGNGRSYGDVCLSESDNVICMKSLNRILSVDWKTGIIRAEAGVTLGDILDISVQNGWFLPVIPGTKFVTLGGAVANDVHGKNHHVRGTFGCHVRRFQLYHCKEFIECSSQSNYEIFQATIGGLGLTGFITWIEVQLIPVQSGMVDTITERFDHLSDFFRLANFYDNSHEYGVAWIDCLAKGNHKGRGTYFAGNHAQYGNKAPKVGSSLKVPFTPPVSMVNPLTLKLFNEFYWRTKPVKPVQKREDYLGYFFPLDSIHHWNRIYGSKGFQQYQCVIPEQFEKDAIDELLSIIAFYNSGSFLAVLKRCGDIKSPGLLSFPVRGTSLALDFPNTKRLKQLMSAMDGVVRQAKGRIYPAKDANMSGEDFRLAYPYWSKLEKLKDPSINSHFWKRVTA